jgi:PKD repeat protein
MKTVLLIALSTLIGIRIQAQDHKHVLFLGNSYTYTNYLPEMLSALALSAGDTVTHSSNTPGGYTFNNHTTNATSLSLIEEGGWDYVVLQEQSQAPSFPIEQVEDAVFPFATQLDNLIQASNPCAETVFYMTWGRENGDASNCEFWPPVCTYEGMDDLLRERYMQMAVDNDAIVCAAGAVWRYIRENNASIDLYQTDGSHPSAVGTYAIACSFYSTLFQKSATLITDDQSVSAEDAAFIRNAVDAVIFNDMETWLIGTYPLVADFTTNHITDFEVEFTSSMDAQNAVWNFGDGQTGNGNIVNHVYTTPGNYTVSLTIEHCGDSATSNQIVVVDNISVDPITVSPIRLYPNPASETITLEMKDSTQINLWNAQGQLVLQQNIKGGSTTLSVSHLPSGLYSLRTSSIGAGQVLIIR